MARSEALLRLHKTLLSRRDELLHKLNDDLNNLRNTAPDSTGDAADAAFEAGSEEMASQLAELDSRELSQIDRAIARLAMGTYGLCESCQGKIPVGRLNALPFSTMCIDCVREMEQSPGAFEERRQAASWDKVFDAPLAMEDQREVKLSELDLDSGR